MAQGVPYSPFLARRDYPDLRAARGIPDIPASAVAFATSVTAARPQAYSVMTA